MLVDEAAMLSAVDPPIAGRAHMPHTLPHQSPNHMTHSSRTNPSTTGARLPAPTPQPLAVGLVWQWPQPAMEVHADDAIELLNALGWSSVNIDAQFAGFSI